MILALAFFRCNAHQIDRYYQQRTQHSQKETHMDEVGVGSGVYPILSLLNHSCDASTIRFNISNKMLLVASR